jgi:hypothetical protein
MTIGPIENVSAAKGFWWIAGAAMTIVRKKCQEKSVPRRFHKDEKDNLK